MTLPDAQDSKYNILKPGKYTCKITKEPNTQRFGKADGIILEFNAKSDEDESVTKTSILLWPFADRDTGYFPYKILMDKIIKSKEESDWVGKTFRAEFEVGPHPTKPDQRQHKIINIEYEKGEEEPDFPPTPEREPGEDEDDIPF